MSVKPDRIWSLNEDHEIATKQSWALFLKHLGYDLDHLSYHDIEKKSNFVASKCPNALPEVSSTSIVPDLPQISERTRKVFKVLNGDAQVYSGGADSSAKTVNKEGHHSLKSLNPGLLQQSFLGNLRNDGPDGEFLRYVRARKFKVLPAVEMFCHSMDWKIRSHPVSKWVMEGDYGLAASEKYPQLMKAFAMEKFYLRGADKHGGSICVIRVKNHHGHDCPEKDFEILICMIIEWAKVALKPYSRDIDGANILFDMSGFSLKNADLSAVKFLAKAFEANYPESLSSIWIHKAPWIFNAVWKIIKGWLDPVVASKIHFTKSVKDLEQFVDISNIPSDLGGKDDYKPKYIQPTKDNSSTLPHDETFSKLIAERDQLLMTFFDTTIAWINAKSKEESTKLLKAKIQLGAEIGNNYVKLDPYLRTRGAFDRDGAIHDISI